MNFIKIDEWNDEEKKLPCLIIKADIGHFCGYVGVKKDHPLYGRSNNRKYEIDLQMHGGLTFSDYQDDRCSHENKGVWWFGFDCAHAWDMGNPKDESYVRNEIKNLAKQLIDNPENKLINLMEIERARLILLSKEELIEIILKSACGEVK